MWRIVTAIMLWTATANAAPLDASQAQREDQAQREYEDRAIGIAGLFSPYGPPGMPYLGRYGKPLVGADFFDAAGRPDLALDYRLRHGFKTALTSAGGALTSVGALTAIVGGTFWGVRAACFADQHCDTSDPETATWAGVGMLGAGVVMWIAGAVIRCPELEPYVIRQLTEEHNEKLRRNLGLSFAPAIGTSGGGMTMDVSF
jgi:hypothetical protein